MKDRHFTVIATQIICLEKISFKSLGVSQGNGTILANGPGKSKYGKSVSLKK